MSTKIESCSYERERESRYQEIIESTKSSRRILPDNPITLLFKAFRLCQWWRERNHCDHNHNHQTCELVNMDVRLERSLTLVIFRTSTHCNWQHLVAETCCWLSTVGDHHNHVDGDLTQVHWRKTFPWCSPGNLSSQKQDRTCNHCPEIGKFIISSSNDDGTDQ